MKRLVGVGILFFPLLLCIGAAGITSAASSYERNHALRIQAQAALEGTRALQTSLHLQFLLIALVIVLLLVLASVAIGGFVFLYRSQKQPKPQWAPGPNARWGKIAQPTHNTLPDMQTLLTMVLVERLLGPSHSQMLTQSPPPALPSVSGSGNSSPEGPEGNDNMPWVKWWE